MRNKERNEKIGLWTKQRDEMRGWRNMGATVTTAAVSMVIAAESIRQKSDVNLLATVGESALAVSGLIVATGTVMSSLVVNQSNHAIAALRGHDDLAYYQNFAAHEPTPGSE